MEDVNAHDAQWSGMCGVELRQAWLDRGVGVCATRPGRREREESLRVSGRALPGGQHLSAGWVTLQRDTKS